MEKPILFTTENVQKIQKGLKTHTRRVIKLPSWSTGDWKDFGLDGNAALAVCERTGCLAEIICPYVPVGTRLWVREAFAYDGCWGMEPMYGDQVFYLNGNFIYKADCEKTELAKMKQRGIIWRSSRFMPRAAARLFLTVTDIRVERVQDISEEDARAEGAEPEFELCAAEFLDKSIDISARSTYKIGFKHIWEDINASRSYGWDTNPYVWVIAFELKK